MFRVAGGKRTLRHYRQRSFRRLPVPSSLVLQKLMSTPKRGICLFAMNYANIVLSAAGNGCLGARLPLHDAYGKMRAGLIAMLAASRRVLMGEILAGKNGPNEEPGKGRSH